MEWYWILLIVIGSILVWLLLSTLFYKQFFKRFYDILLSSLAIIVLSPFFLIFTPINAICMKGNPFFCQYRPGKKRKDGKCKIFKLIKYRSMTNEKDKNGNLLPDDKRLTKFGKFLRSTSLDELPELFNIFVGDMSIVGPRPLLVQYLSRYNEKQSHRQDVRPGLTGYAQVHGRNVVSWEDKFDMDVWYTQHISMFGDIKIIFRTVITVLKKDGITSNTSVTNEEFMGTLDIKKDVAK